MNLYKTFLLIFCKWTMIWHRINIFMVFDRPPNYAQILLRYWEFSMPRTPSDVSLALRLLFGAICGKLKGTDLMHLTGWHTNQLLQKHVPSTRCMVFIRQTCVFYVSVVGKSSQFPDVESCQFSPLPFYFHSPPQTFAFLPRWQRFTGWPVEPSASVIVSERVSEPDPQLVALFLFNATA